MTGDPVAETAAVAIVMGVWPFSRPLLEMDPHSDEWLLACHALDAATRLKHPPTPEEG